MKIAKEIEKIIKEIAGDDQLPNVLEENFDLSNDYVFDSIMMIEMVVKIEKLFSIEFTFEELDIEKLYKFGEIVKLVEQHIEER